MSDKNFPVTAAPSGDPWRPLAPTVVLEPLLLGCDVGWQRREAAGR